VNPVWRWRVDHRLLARGEGVHLKESACQECFLYSLRPGCLHLPRLSVRGGGGARPDAGDVGVEVRVGAGAGAVVSAGTYTPPNSVLPSGERDCRHSLTSMFFPAIDEGFVLGTFEGPTRKPDTAISPTSIGEKNIWKRQAAGNGPRGDR
jgi:hypothetical protein